MGFVFVEYEMEELAAKGNYNNMYFLRMTIHIYERDASMPTYNKLVRERIPFIITSQGKECRTRTLNPEEYVAELKVKLNEESEEYFKSNNDQEALEELADMLEVIRALAETHGSNWAELENIRAYKAEARGGFQERVYLIDVDEV